MVYAVGTAVAGQTFQLESFRDQRSHLICIRRDVLIWLMKAKVARALTLIGIAMIVISLAMAWDTDRQRLNPMGDPEFRFMIKVSEPWAIGAVIVFLTGCCVLSFTATLRKVLLGGAALGIGCLIFVLTMSQWVNIHGWTGEFLYVWLVACIATFILIGVGVGRRIVRLLTRANS